MEENPAGPPRRHTPPTGFQPKEWTHCNLLIVDLSAWFTPDRGDIKMTLYEPHPSVLKGLSWEARVFAALFGVKEVSILHGRQENLQGTVDAYCWAHCLYAVLKIVAGAPVNTKPHGGYKFVLENPARVYGPHELLAEMGLTTGGGSTICGPHFTDSWYPLFYFMPWINCSHVFYDRFTSKSRDYWSCELFHDFMNAIRNYRIEKTEGAEGGEKAAGRKRPRRDEPSTSTA